MRQQTSAPLVSCFVLCFVGLAACSSSKGEPGANLPGTRRALGATVRCAVIGDFGVPSADAANVASLVRSLGPDIIITTGDNNYPDGAAATIDANIGSYYASYISPYRGSFGPGAETNRFFPSLGNHDWVAPGAQPYLAYFTLPGNERYYTFARGEVQFFAVDADPHEPDGVTSTSAQGAWLRNSLAASTSRWKVVYFHQPPFSSGPHGPTAYMQWPFREWGVDLVLSGHDHVYERFDKGGTPYIVNGMGGNERYAFGTPTADSVVRYNGAPGALLIEADAATLRVAFRTVGGALIDQVTLPNLGVPLRGQAANDAASNTYSLGGGQAFTWRRVYIDADTSTGTGFPAGGVGADFLVENARLYRHGGGGWNWGFVAAVGFTVTGGGVDWIVSRDAIGQTAYPNTDALSFEVETPGGAFQNLGRTVHVYTAAGVVQPPGSPPTAPINTYAADNDAASINYRATFASPFTYKHVLIDTDTNQSTGYAYAGIGADYLVENERLYRHGGSGWTWTKIADVATTGALTGPRVWTIPRATLSETARSGELADVLFHGFGDAAEYATAPFRHVYSATGP